MNRLIDEFVKEVTTHDNSFLLGNEQKHYLFTQAKIGDVRLVYGAYVYGEEFVLDAIGKELELKAVVCAGSVYIIDQYFFDLWPSKFDVKDLPGQVKLFYDAVRKVNTYTGETLFTKFYEKLEVKDVPAKSVEQEARNRLLSLNPELPKVTHNNTLFDENDVIKLMSGSLDVDAEANRIFEKKKEDWIVYKSENAKIAELVENKTVAEPWEIEIVEGLRYVPDAKSVNVTFELDGKTAEEKVDTKTLMQMLCKKDYFSSYNFCNQKRGDRLLKELGADYPRRLNSKLTCENITKITYGKKILFERKKEEVK